MKIEAKGLGEFDISDRDYLATGGQAIVYAKGNYAFKIYHNDSDTLPESKIKDLGCLDRKEVIIPKYSVFKKEIRVGYASRFLKDFEPICKLFSNGYWTANNIDAKSVGDLVNKMREVIDFIHSKNCLIIDPNEMNFLFKSQAIGFIDTDNYQTPNCSNQQIFIAPQIRDYSAAKINNLSDWFGFAVVACQMFIGCHPFKGDFDGFKRQDIKQKQLAKKSIFTKDVELPSNIRDFSLIPDEYFKWFSELFHGGKRTLPPQALGNFKVMKKAHKTIRPGRLKIKVLETFQDDVKWHYFYQKRFVKTVKTDKNLLDIDGRIHRFWLENNGLIWDGTEIGKATNIMVFEKSVFVLSGNQIRQYNVKLNTPYIVAMWGILPNSTKMLDKVVVSDILGRFFLFIPYSFKNLQQIQIKELAGCKIVTGKRNGRCVLIVVNEKGIYNKHLFLFNETFSEYKHIVYSDVSYLDANFAYLDTGVVAVMTEDGIDLLTYTKPETVTIKDDSISTNMILSSENDKLVFYHQNKLFSLEK